MKNSGNIAWLILLNIIFLYGRHCAQDYTWVKGDAFPDQPGVYGTKGVSSPTNLPGGRTGAATYTDVAGNLWMFGGLAVDVTSYFSNMNDLWKYSVNTNQWTWISGDSLADGKAMYGTPGISSPTNLPGSRAGASMLGDASGNLWLYGGVGLDALDSLGAMTDLWKYNIATNQWVWIKGSNLRDQPAKYGIVNVSSPNNRPGARSGQAFLKDLSGDFWMFGGYGLDSSGNQGTLNDFWRYKISTNEWTWIKGTDLLDQYGTYGNIGTTAQTNRPGGRSGATGWTDAAGDFWLFGGIGYASSGSADFLNDLWKYNIASNSWTWIKGSNIISPSATYGIKGVAANNNVPGARTANTSWADYYGNLWIFGGLGYDALTNIDNLNDLWKYHIGTNQWTWIKGSSLQNQNAIYGNMGTPGVQNTPGAQWGGVNWTDTKNNLWHFGGLGLDSLGNMGALNDLWKFSVCTAKDLTVTSNGNIICQGETATITVSGAASYSWSSSQNGASIPVSPSITTTYTVFSADVTGCKSSSSITLSVAACQSLIQSDIEGGRYSIYPNPNNGGFTIKSDFHGETLHLTIINNLGQEVYEDQLVHAATSVRTNLPAGMYHYYITSREMIQTAGKFVIE
jgi:N-acetylneuraminic acid mutarotase